MCISEANSGSFRGPVVAWFYGVSVLPGNETRLMFLYLERHWKLIFRGAGSRETSGSVKLYSGSPMQAEWFK